MSDEHPLPSRGFQPVETLFPGGWWTDGKRTVCILTRWQPASSRSHYRCLVFDESAEDVDLTTDRLATSQHSLQWCAAQQALDEADLASAGGGR